MRHTQVKKLTTPGALRDHLAALGVDLQVDDDVDAHGALAQPVVIEDGTAGRLTVANRFAVLPMEGWDGTTDGRPTELVRRRWSRFGASGCGLVWGEATAVVPEGRANPNQLVISDQTIDDLADLRALLAPEQVVGLQLTHSGRWSRPDGTPRPQVAHRHPVLDGRTAEPGPIITDDELDELGARFVAAAVLVRDAGFDFVDVKCCHGYLLHELLSARDRDGVGFVRDVISGIRRAAPELAVAVRLSIFDLVPFRTGDDGVGTPERVDGAPRPFGADASGLVPDLADTHGFLDVLTELGVGLVCTTAGSPYYNPHIQRPAFFPPSDGYQPPEDPLVGVARQVAATAVVKARHPAITFVGSGYSYLQDWLAHVAQPVVARGGADLVGLGRMVLSYPDLAADVLAGRPLDRRLVCRTFSDCTTAPRSGLVSGCYPLDEFYKQRPEREVLAGVKADIRRGGRARPS